MAEMNIDTFGEIMNNAITEADIKMLIEMPKGTQEPRVTATGISTVDFYIILAALKPTMAQMIRDMGGMTAVDVPGVLDEVFAMLKSDIMEYLEEATPHDP